MARKSLTTKLGRCFRQPRNTSYPQYLLRDRQYSLAKRAVEAGGGWFALFEVERRFQGGVEWPVTAVRESVKEEIRGA